MKNNSIRTGEKTASKASAVLKDKKAGKTAKKLAGSVLCNRKK